MRSLQLGLCVLVLCSLSAVTSMAQGKVEFRCYIDKDGAESVLIYDADTGASKLYFYNPSKEKMELAPYQLPTKPIDAKGRVGMDAYIDKDGAETILVWDTTTGASKLYFYDPSKEAFALAPYQLPAKPLDAAGAQVMMDGYVDKDGAESFMVWDAKSGASKLYFFSPQSGKVELAPYQLPAKPLGNK